MMQKVTNLKRVLIVVCCVLVLGLSAFAQKPTTPAKRYTGTSESCEGALDIVPSKSMSFVRKRRPGKAEGKTVTQPADAKSDKKPAPEEKKGR